MYFLEFCFVITARPILSKLLCSRNSHFSYSGFVACLIESVTAALLLMCSSERSERFSSGLWSTAGVEVGRRLLQPAHVSPAVRQSTRGSPRLLPPISQQSCPKNVSGLIDIHLIVISFRVGSEAIEDDNLQGGVRLCKVQKKNI